MTTLYISPNSPFESIGGVERYLMNLIQYAQTADANTVILIPSYDENRVETRGNVTFYFDKSLRVARTQRANAKNVEAFAKIVTEIIETHNIDVICAENFHLGMPPAYSLQLNMVAAMRAIPIVLRLHSFASTQLQTELINQLPWKRVSCVSRSVTGDCFHKGANIDTLETDYLGVDTSVFNTDVDSTWLKKELSLAPETQVVLTASRIVHGSKNILKEKGIISTIRAFAKLAPRFPDMRLVIAVGRAPSNLQEAFDHTLEMLHGYLKLHGVEKSTIVRAFTLDEMPLVYRGADVFVLASENETFGQVFIEAMACGTPAIGTNVGGIPEIISDLRNGYLVPAYNPTVLAHKIESLLTDTDMRDAFRRRGLRAVQQRFNAKTQFELFDQELAELVPGHVSA
jgi:glycosyltransferase involved in cell wall biosynthesis